MIIPISPVEGKIRRVPWISVAIIVANVVVFLLVGLPAMRADQEQDKTLQAIYDFWKERPYLQLPPEFMEAVISREDQEKVALLIEQVKTMVGGQDALRRLGEQRELDQLIERYLVARSHDSFRTLGLIPARPQPVAFITAMFMHASWLHLLGNLLMFYLTGPFLEDVYGRIIYPIFYLAAGIVSALGHMAAFPSSDIPLVGASGAIAGLMGAFLIRFIKAKMRFFYWIFIFFGTFSAPAWVMLVLWIGQQFLLASYVQGEGGVAYLAHIGGFGFGVVVAVVIGALRIEEKYIHPKIEARISITQHPAVEEGMAFLSKGQTLPAREALNRALAADPKNPDAHLGIWESYVADGTPELGAGNMEQVIEDALARGEPLAAFEHWTELVQRLKNGGSPGLRWRLASRLQDMGEPAAAEVFASLAEDPAAEIMAAKAASRLAVLASTPSDRAHWQARADAMDREIQSATAVPALSPPPARQPRGDAVGPQSAGAEFLVEPGHLERMTPEALMLRGATGGTPDALFYGNITALAVAGISAGERPYILLDLVLRPLPGRPRPVIRLLSNQLNPQQLTGVGGNPLDAFRELIRRIAAAAGVPVSPEPEFIAGGRVSMFASVPEYERAVLQPLLRRR